MNLVNNEDINEFVGNLNGLPQSEASQRIFQKLNEIASENGEEGLKNSDWVPVLTEAYSKANPHSEDPYGDRTE